MFGPRASLPPFLPGHPQMLPPASAQMYRLVQQNSSQLSPTGNAGNVPARTGASPHHSVGFNETPPNIVLPLHPQGQPNIMFFGHQPSIPIQALSDKISLVQPMPRISQQAPGLIQNSPVGMMQLSPGVARQASIENFKTQQFPHPSSAQLVTESKEGAPPIPSPLSTRSNLVSEVTPTPVIIPTPQPLSMLGHYTNQNAHPLSVLGPINHHEQALLPTATAQLPPTEDKVPSVRPVPLRVPNSRPLLPNPPGPLLPHPPSTQQNQRKETVCKHFVAGLCPYGEKCWFAHPEPIIGSTPQTCVDPTPANTVVYGSRGVLSPAEAAHGAWINGSQMMPSVLPPFGLVSPPQSPLNTGEFPPLFPYHIPRT